MDRYNISDINYELEGKGPLILFIHGWGNSLSSMKVINQKLYENYSCLFIDLPGFGKSPEPTEALSTYDYTNIIYQFLKNKNYNPIVIIGHSFGGKVACGLALKINIAGLFLISPSAISNRRGFSYYYKIYKYKLYKKLGRNVTNYGSSDYLLASGVMKATIVKVLNTYYKRDLHAITAPTILYWGSNDKATPIKLGHKIQKMIPNCSLITVNGASHFAHIDNQKHFNFVLEAFLKEVFKTC